MAPNRTEELIRDDFPFQPLTWRMDVKQVELVWKETVEVFGNKLWVESMLYGVFHSDWQEEITRRAGKGLFDVLCDAVGALEGGDDPSFVFLGFERTFARYAITLEFAAHPLHGDVVARALGLEVRGQRRLASGPVTWLLGAEDVQGLWDGIEDQEDTEFFADSLETALGPERSDELRLRIRCDLGQFIYSEFDELACDDPSLVFLRLRDLFAEEQVTLEFAPHPEYGDVIQRALEIAAGLEGC